MQIRWTNLSPAQIQQALTDKGYQVSYYIVRELLKHYGFKKRKHFKSNSLGQVEGRDEQFKNIAVLKEEFILRDLPVLSIDTKKKELLGNFYRAGSHYAREARKVNDHDFVSFADGQVVPHGIYDVAKNQGYLTLGTSKDTSAFVCNNLEQFWITDLQWVYPDADCMLLLCDSGGSNSCRHYIVKQDLWHLAQRLQINIVVAHYPAYCSKWNPIEHQLFCHVHRAWQGAVFENIQIVKELAQNTSTQTGLEVKVHVNTKQYETKRAVQNDFKENLDEYIQFADSLPKWNYMILYEN